MAITFIKQEDGEIECTQQISTDLNTISHRSSEQQTSISNQGKKKTANKKLKIISYTSQLHFEQTLCCGM